MYILLLGLLVGIVVVSKLHGKQPSAGLRYAQIGLLGVTALLVALQGVRACVPPPPFTSAREVFEEAAGYRLGQLLASEVREPGTVLVVQWQGTTDSAQDNVEAQLAGLRAGLGDSELNVVVRGPAFPEGDEGLTRLLFQGVPVTDAELEQWVKEAEDLVGIVSFIEVAGLMHPKKLKDLPPVYLKGVAPSPRVEALVSRGFLKAVVVDKSGINVTEEPPRGLSREELFDLRFNLLSGTSFTRAVFRTSLPMPFPFDPPASACVQT